MRSGSEYIVRITNTRGWYKGLWGQRVSVVKDRINIRGVLTEVWRDAVKVSAEILIGVKRYRECLERQESWRVVNQVRGRLEVFELVEKIMSGR